MAPSKSLPQSKLDLVTAFFHTTAVAYTLKDLEKLLPSAAGISSMAVKDYLTSLTADSKLTVEKIGSGNWYWSFPADAKVGKQRGLDAARAERDKLAGMVEEAKRALAEEGAGGDDEGKKEAVERLKELRARRGVLVEEFKGVKEAGELKGLLERTNVVIGNLMVLEDWVKRKLDDPERYRAFRENLGFPEEWDEVEYSGP